MTDRDTVAEVVSGRRSAGAALGVRLTAQEHPRRFPSLRRRRDFLEAAMAKAGFLRWGQCATHRHGNLHQGKKQRAREVTAKLAPSWSGRNQSEQPLAAQKQRGGFGDESAAPTPPP